MKEEAITKESSSFIVPALISGVVSAGLALLLTPKSGREMRQDIGRLVKGTGEQAGETFEQAKSEISQAAIQESVAAGKEKLMEPVEKRTSLIVPILISGVIGAALALLLAPKSGKEVIEDIKDFASTAADKSKSLYEKGVSAVKEAIEKGKEAAVESKEKLRPAA